MKTRLNSLNRLLVAVPFLAAATAAVPAPAGSAPRIGIDPGWLSADGSPGGGPVTLSLAIANSGDGDLEWTLTEAPTGRPPVAPPWTTGAPAAPPAAAAAAWPDATWTPGAATAGAAARGSDEGCDAATPGIIIHDDGVPESGYGPINQSANQAIFVDRFTPASYPASFTRACVTFISSGDATEQDFEVVVYDESGTNGAPGALLGAVKARATDMPPTMQAAFVSVDISSLHLDIAAGSIYIGVRYNPLNPGRVYVAADQSSTTPNAGGYGWFDSVPFWQRIQNLGIAFSGYKAMLIRAVERPNHCAKPEDVAWLSTSASSGTVAPGADTALTVSLDPGNLAAGHYAADLCVASNDPTQPLRVVPIEFTVGSVLPTAQIGPGQLDFAAETNVITSDLLSIANSGAAGSSLTWEIAASAGDCTTPTPAPWLTAQPSFGQLAAGASAAPAVYASSFGAAPGPRTGMLCVTTNDAAHPLVAIPVTLTVSDATRLFGDSFEDDGTRRLAIDDGGAEEYVGYAGPFLWLNRYTPEAAQLPMRLTQVQVYWSAAGVTGFPTGVALGQGFDVFVYVDPDGDPATGAQFLASAVGQTVSVLDDFQTIDLPQPVAIGAGSQGDILIAIVNRGAMTGQNVVPAAIDETAPQGRSWLGVYTLAPPATPPVLPANLFGTIESVSANAISGNWLIRGLGVRDNGTPVTLR